MTELLQLEMNHIPKLPRHAKLRYDEARKIWIINAPERVFELDAIASEIIQMVNGEDSVENIVDELCKKFEGAPKEIIAKDTLSMLQSLADKGFIVI